MEAVLLVMTTSAVKRLRNSHIPRRKERSDLGARGTIVLGIPSLSSIFLHFNKSFLKIVPLTKRMTSVAGISDIVMCQQR